MKNFFKKLSFVLAIAMVLTTIAPATASAAEVVPAKKVNVKNVNGEKITSVELDVEETETVKIGLPVKKAYAGQKSTFKTWAVAADETVVDVNRVGNRKYELTGVAAGETTITINAAKTKKAAVAGKDHGCKPITITVVVNEKAAELTAAQTGAKEITVTGLNGTAKDGMTVSLKKGNSTINVSAVKAEDENTLVLTTAAKIQDAEYVVTVAETELAFTGELAKLTTLGITDTNAVLNAELQAATEVTVPYETLDQFGDPYKVSAIEAVSTLGSADAADGIITISFTNENLAVREGQTYTITLIAEMMTASETVTIVAAGRAKTVEFGALVNAYGKAFNDGNQMVFKQYVTIRDQYDRVMLNPAIVNDQVVINNTLQGVIANADDEVKFDSETYSLYIEVTPLKAGTTTLNVMPKWYGGTASLDLEVGHGVKVDTIVFDQPEIAVQGEAVAIPFEAYDTEGNLVTDYSTLDAFAANVKVNGATDANVTFKKNFTTGDVYYVTDGTINSAYLTVSATTTTLKTAYVNIATKLAAKPVLVAGINPKAITAAVTGQSITLKASDFVVYDQYDRVMNNYSSLTDLSTLLGTDDGKYAIVVTGTAIGTGSVFEIGSGAQIFDAMADQLVLNVTDGAVTSATYGVTAKLVCYDEGNAVDVKNSEYDLKLSAVVKSELVSFEIKTADKIYAATTGTPTTHEEKFEVYGSTAKGLKVLLDPAAGDYDVVSSSVAGAFASANKNTTMAAVSGHAVFTDVYNPSEANDVTIYVKLFNGAVITKTVTVCEAAPVLTSIVPVPNDTAITGADGNYVVVESVANAADTDEVLGHLVRLDQYGKLKTDDQVIVVVSDLPYGATVEDNGSDTATVTGVGAGKSYTATYTIGSFVVTVKVIAE